MASIQRTSGLKLLKRNRKRRKPTQTRSKECDDSVLRLS